MRPCTAGTMLEASAGFCYAKGQNETIASKLQGEFCLPQPVLQLYRRRVTSAASRGAGRVPGAVLPT